MLVEQRKRYGATVVRVTTYNGGAMRKHGTWRAEIQDGRLAALDRTAHAAVHYDRSATVRVRRARG